MPLRLFDLEEIGAADGERFRGYNGLLRLLHRFGVAQLVHRARWELFVHPFEARLRDGARELADLPSVLVDIAEGQIVLKLYHERLPGGR